MSEFSYIDALGWRASRLRVRPELDLQPDEPATNMYLAQHEVIQDTWNQLQLRHEREGAENLREDHSKNGVVMLAGRFLLPPRKAGDQGGKRNAVPVYWAVHDNRVHFSVRFDSLNPKERMQLVNQVLVSYAARSHKDDLKSASLCVTESGHFFITTNTQEPKNLDIQKQCAEDRLAGIVQQLAAKGEKVAHMYVLGGITDEQGKMHIQDYWIGMCLRCVEVVSSVMAPKANVTVIPPNDGEGTLGLRRTNNSKDLDPGEAWEISYRKLKGPSVVKFSDEVNVRQKQVFEDICAGRIVANDLFKKFKGNIKAERVLTELDRGIVGVPFLEANPSEDAINAFMVARIAREMKRNGGDADHVAVAVVDINDKGKQRFTSGLEMRGNNYNAMISPVSLAIASSAIQRPDAQDRPYIQRVYVMGYNKDGSPLNLNAEQWDRVLKRVGKERAKETEVVFIPLNDGSHYPDKDVDIRKLGTLARTGFVGSLQERQSLQEHAGRCGC